ncbi:MAG: type 1 glutamine amidotransferase domain-containing protein [Planctomycetota bacterium]
MPTQIDVSLDGLRIAILATDGFEPSELTEPLESLRACGAKVDVLSLEPGSIRGWKKEWTDEVPVDRTLDEASVEDYHALVLPGGVINPDALRLSEKAIGFIRAFGEAKKPIAAICHGPWTLIDAGLVKGREVTSWPSLRRDLENAGATWRDREVVQDANIITSRKPDDLPAFVQTIAQSLSEVGAERAR